MALVRPRLTDYHGIALSQEQVDFAIPFLDEDIPLYVDPFLLWKSPSLQDNALHTAIVSAFNHIGRLATQGGHHDAKRVLIALSECDEVGLGSSRTRQGKRIGEGTAEEILSLFRRIPQVQETGFGHIEEVQLLVDQISKDRISDFTASLIKSFLIDYTIDQCNRLGIPREVVTLSELYDYRKQRLIDEQVKLPINPTTRQPVLLVPKRWLRYSPWINYDDYFAKSFVEATADEALSRERTSVLSYNRENYGLVRSYVELKERTSADAVNDPLFRPIPVVSAKRKLAQIKKLKTGNQDKADKLYEDYACQLLASLLYPQLDFADDQVRSDSGVTIRDLVFYNSRSMDFLQDIHTSFGSSQIVFELKNVAAVEREHINQLNRYLNEHFGKFGVLLTRNPLPRAMFRHTIDLWSGQRKCIIALTDADVELMVSIFETKQRSPIEVVKRAYIEFMRACPT